MRRAFHPETGPLTDTSRVAAERDAEMALFAGAIGHAKNPPGHRDVDLIYFGYPEAHEDDAERAARAGLAVVDAVGRLATPEPLNVRIGIASGLVVVGDLIGAGAA
jgi:class 3 adenylate cyclase